jgi:hypothetical protein
MQRDRQIHRATRIRRGLAVRRRRPPTALAVFMEHFCNRTSDPSFSRPIMQVASVTPTETRAEDKLVFKAKMSCMF